MVFVSRTQLIVKMSPKRENVQSVVMVITFTITFVSSTIHIVMSMPGLMLQENGTQNGLAEEIKSVNVVIRVTI